MATIGFARSGALDIVTHHLHAAHSKWDRLTDSDYKVVKTARDLVFAVAARYSLPHDEAKRAVETWLRDVGR
jgi:hypothetical protein